MQPTPDRTHREGARCRWIVGSKLYLIINHLGGITNWEWVPANAHDTWFHPIIEVFQHHRVVLGIRGFMPRLVIPPNLKLFRRGEWNDRMVPRKHYA